MKGLYVKSVCLACRGLRRTTNNRHCPYCDEHGMSFIECSMSAFLQTLQSLSIEEKEEVIQCLIDQSLYQLGLSKNE